MNNVSFYSSVIFENPENKPLEDLILTVKNDGVTTKIPALDKNWVEKKYFIHYEPPILIDSEEKYVIGSKEQWLKSANYMLDDLTWLIKLPFYKFWSNIIYNSSIIDSLVYFLQEAPTFLTLENFPDDHDIINKFNSIRKNVLLIFTRLSSNIETEAEYISLSKYAFFLYNKFIFTVPILIDLCQHYGRDNKTMVEKIINSVFSIQPLYNQDLVKSTLFIIQALSDIEEKFENCLLTNDGKAVPLFDRDEISHEITLIGLEDIVLYLLDIMSSISIFIDIYPSAISSFEKEQFFTKIVSIYGNSIPEMYKRLHDLAFKDETVTKYVELKHRLDVIRVEILNNYRNIVRNKVKDVIENRDSYSSSEIGDIMEDYLTNLIYTLSEKDFVIDYYNCFPIIEDFQIMLDLHPDLDIVKYKFIVDSIFTFKDMEKPSLPFINQSHEVPKTETASSLSNQVSTEDKSTDTIKSEVDLATLIYEVKDILCDLGDGFIEKCLKYYNYDKESVINAVLENSLPNELSNLDHTLPIIPPDPDEASAAVDLAIGNQRLNIFDNDEFDIMTKDKIDTSRVHKGKKKDKYKNFSQLINDKSHIAESKNIYEKYNIITSEYDDEYDDTYDDHDIGSNAQDDALEVDARPFTIPRILQKQDKNDLEEVEEDNFENDSDFQIKRDNFVEDPAVLRAKAEEKRLCHQKNRPQNKNVIGSPKGQGQTKEVSDSRNQKNKNKSSRANHNRRAGSQWKRSHGMVPS